MFSNYPIVVRAPAGSISKSRGGYRAAGGLRREFYSVAGFESLQTSAGDR